MPHSARPARNSAQVVVTAQTRHPTANRTPQISTTRFLPIRSPSLPTSTMVAPPATPRMVMDQVTFAPACGNDAASFGTMLEIIDCWNVMASANSTSATTTAVRRQRDAPSSLPASSSPAASCSPGALPAPENSVCSAMRCPPRLPICLLADAICERFRRLRRLGARSAGHLSPGAAQHLLADLARRGARQLVHQHPQGAGRMPWQPFAPITSRSALLVIRWVWAL